MKCKKAFVVKTLRLAHTDNGALLSKIPIQHEACGPQYKNVCESRPGLTLPINQDCMQIIEITLPCALYTYLHQNQSQLFSSVFVSICCFN